MPPPDTRLKLRWHISTELRVLSAHLGAFTSAKLIWHYFWTSQYSAESVLAGRYNFSYNLLLRTICFPQNKKEWTGVYTECMWTVKQATAVFRQLRLCKISIRVNTSLSIVKIDRWADIKWQLKQQHQCVLVCYQTRVRENTRGRKSVAYARYILV